MIDHSVKSKIYGTTILTGRKNGKVVVIGDGQVDKVAIRWGLEYMES